MKSPFTSVEAQRLGDIIAKLEARVQQLEQGRQQSRLSYSSIENAHINAYDAQGVVRQRLGRQEDGTFAVSYRNGAPPPTPTDPEVTGGQLSLIVYWDGGFRSGAQKPADFVRCDVHICRDEDLVGGDFEVGPQTLYGSLLTESAVTIPLDTSTYWVKLVAVNTSDVASDPTMIIQGAPAAAYQIAASSIGAEQLASEIVLASKIIAGNPEGQRFEIDTQGIRGYDNQGAETIGQEPDTGNIVFRGTLSTAEEGERIVINDPSISDGRKAINFYGPDGTEYASIRHYPSFDASSVGIFVDSSPANPAGGANHRGIAAVTPHGFHAGTVQDTTSDYMSALFSRKDFLSLIAPEHAFDILRGKHPANGSHSVKVRMWDWNGSSYAYTQGGVEFMPSPGNAAAVGLHYTHRDVSLYGFGGQLYVKNFGDSAFRAINASAFTVNSDSGSKTNITDMSFSALHTILSTPAKEWNRSGEDNPDKARHYGPLADQLPEAVTGYDEQTGQRMLNLGDMIGLIWAAIHELAKEHGIQPDPSKFPPRPAK